MTTENGVFWNQSWNPLKIKGGGYFCTRVSPGCQNCWCYSFNKRFGNGLPFDNRTVEFELNQRILEAPLHWKKPRVIATFWLGDLFHEQIPDLFIKNIIFASEAWDWHKYLFLTKRIERAKEILDKLYSQDVRPYDNLWLGVSISTQKEADEKIPLLLATPAAHRYVNLEPMLADIDLNLWLPSEQWDWTYTTPPNRLDWVLLGCESGPGRRPMKLEWARSIAEQCKAAGIPLWIKQLELEDWENSVYKAKTKVSKDMNEWPEDLRIRQSPW